MFTFSRIIHLKISENKQSTIQAIQKKYFFSFLLQNCRREREKRQEKERFVLTPKKFQGPVKCDKEFHKKLRKFVKNRKKYLALETTTTTTIKQNESKREAVKSLEYTKKENINSLKKGKFKEEGVLKIAKRKFL